MNISSRYDDACRVIAIYYYFVRVANCLNKIFIMRDTRTPQSLHVQRNCCFSVRSIMTSFRVFLPEVVEQTSAPFAPQLVQRPVS